MFGWYEGRVRDLVTSIDAGVSVNGEARKRQEGDIGVLKVSAVSSMVFDPYAYKVVIKKDLDRVKESPLKGHIIVSRSNTPDLVGASALVDENYSDLFLSDKLWQLKLNSKRDISAKWFALLLASAPIRYRLSRLATGTSNSMKNISKNDLLTLPIVIPPLGEQREIARIITSWDSAISVTSQQITTKQEQRKVLMHQLLSGKRRFPEFIKSNKITKTRWIDIPSDWAYPRIGDIAKAYSVKNTDANDLPVLSCTKHYGLVDSLEYFGKQVFSKDLSTYKIVKQNQFAYATNHIEEGSIGYQNLYDEAVISPMYTVFETNDKVNDRFLFLLLKTELYRHIFESNTSKTVDRRGSLRWNDFSRLHIPLPSLQEQQAIVRVFELVDKELDLLEQQLAAYKEQKKGLMQQLLTGKIRVNATQAA